MSSTRSIVFWLLLNFATSVQAQGTISGVQPAGLTLFTPEYVRIVGGCPETQKVDLAPGMSVGMEHLCDPSHWTRTVRPVACTGATMAILGVGFRGRPGTVLAESLVLSEKHFHIRLFGRMEDAHGPKAEVEKVERVEWCIGETPDPGPPQLPATACTESRQFAVAFDYGTPMSNKILTNGFSFYIRVSGRPPVDLDFDAVAAEVLSSFQNAMTIWTAALSDHNALLTPDIRAFIKSRTATSTGGYQLLTPPQVVRLECPQAATFIIEISFGGDGVFPSYPSPLMLAKGRLEGRTIALNLRDVDCFKTISRYDAANMLPLKDDRCTNLLPVLVHELGHAFGIPHIPQEQGSALMNPELQASATVPRELDVRAFVTALERSITGAQPGVLEFRASEGLLAPKGWVAVRRGEEAWRAE